MRRCAGLDNQNTLASRENRVQKCCFTQPATTVVPCVQVFYMHEKFERIDLNLVQTTF